MLELVSRATRLSGFGALGEANRSSRYENESASEGWWLVTQIFTSWNRMAAWLMQIEGLWRVA